MTQNAISRLVGEVEAGPVVLQPVDNAQTLFVVPETGEDTGERRFAGMTEWCVSEIVAKGNGFRQVLIQGERTRDGASDLGDFQGMGETRTEVVAGRREEDLGLVFQPAKRLRVDDAVSVALKLGAQVRRSLRARSSGASRACRGWSQPFVFALFEPQTNRGHAVFPSFGAFGISVRSPEANLVGGVFQELVPGW
jgi:hypothetical protein